MGARRARPGRISDWGETGFNEFETPPPSEFARARPDFSGIRMRALSSRAIMRLQAVKIVSRGESQREMIFFANTSRHDSTRNDSFETIHADQIGFRSFARRRERSIGEADEAGRNSRLDY